MSQQKEIPLAFISNSVSKKKSWQEAFQFSENLKEMWFKFTWYFFLPLLSMRSHWWCFGNKGPVSFQSVCRNRLLMFLYLMEIQTWDLGRFESEAQCLTFFIIRSCKLPLPTWRQDSCLADLTLAIDGHLQRVIWQLWQVDHPNPLAEEGRASLVAECWLFWSGDFLFDLCMCLLGSEEEKVHSERHSRTKVSGSWQTPSIISRLFF